jgi:hypothetical protein
MKRWLIGSSVLGVVAMANLPTGCSRGGAPEGWTPARDGGADLASPWGRPDLRAVPDLMRPQPRTTVSFAAAVTYPSDQLAFQIVSGRINNDAFPDIVAGGSTFASIYMNRGDGTFEVKTFTANGNYWQLAVEDLNGDGLGDLALTDISNSRIVVAMGRGDGTFDAGTPYLAGKPAHSLVATDLTGDKAPELVAGSYTTNNMHVLLNDGRGVFRDGMIFPPDAMMMANPLWLGSTDVNGDGRADVVVSNYSAGTVNLFLGNGDGTLGAGQTIARHPKPMATGFADFDFDGKLDFALVRESDQQVHVFLGKGDGTFSEGTPLMLSATTGQGVRVADVNGDYIVDVVAACAFSTGARVFLGRGDGTFTAEQVFPGAGSSPFNLVIGDWNQDGLNDLALDDSSSRTISVLMNTTRP